MIIKHLYGNCNIFRRDKRDGMFYKRVSDQLKYIIKDSTSRLVYTIFWYKY